MRMIPVRLTGSWQPVAYVGHVEWRGMASADEPITALALCRSAGAVRWSRVGRAARNELDIALKIKPDEATRDRYAIRGWLSVQPTGQQAGSGQAILPFRTVLESTAPFLFALDQIETGQVSWFAQLWNGNEDAVGAIFVVESDTRAARNRLWHLREGIDGPSDPASAALNYGRSGRLPGG